MHENPLIEKTLKKLTVKIFKSDNEVGTGFILRSENLKNSLLIVTAKHNLYEDIEKDDYDVKNELVVVFFDDNEDELLVYSLKNGDRVLKSPNKEDDIIALLIDTQSLLNPVDSFPIIRLIKDSYGEKNTIFYGFPNVDLSRNIHRIDSTVSTYSETRLTLDYTVHSEASLTVDSLRGFSGSGLGLICNNAVYLLGIITDYIDIKKFEAVNISLLNKILTHNKLDEFKFLVIETNESLICDNKLLEDVSDRVIDNIETTIEGVFFNRKDLLDEAFDKVINSNLVAINGDAGVGKSAFSKVLLDKIRNEFNWKLLSFRGEQICTDSLYDTLKSCGVSNSFNELLKSKDFLNDVIIYIDSAEKIIENNSFGALIELIKLSNKNKKVKILMSIRSYAFSQITTLGLINEHTKRYSVITVPFLDKSELEKITKSVPLLENILKIEKISDIIKTPFYLKYIINNIEAIQLIKDVDELKLKSMLWDKVIKKGDKRRQDLFSNIAIKRLEEIRSHTTVDNALDNVLQSLLDDNLLKEYKNSIGVALYSPTHDIFEDWSLVRYISKCFELRTSNNQFFDSIDKGYAFRRGFRIWVHENLKIPISNDSIIGFFFECLNSDHAELRWKEEIITALLKSSYSISFFDENKSWLLNDSAKNLIWFINLLRLTCKAFPSTRIPNQLDDRIYFSTNSLSPTGPGWATILKFINENFEELKEQTNLISNLLLIGVI